MITKINNKFKYYSANGDKKEVIMKKLALILLIFIIFIYGCQNPYQATETKKENKILSDIQVTACDTAHEASTCDTRLPELGIVLKEDCCEVLGKCC